jgi:hypothetical protein
MSMPIPDRLRRDPRAWSAAYPAVIAVNANILSTIQVVAPRAGPDNSTW